VSNNNSINVIWDNRKGSVEKIKNHSIFVGVTLAGALWNRVSERAGARPAPTFAFSNTPQELPLLKTFDTGKAYPYPKLNLYPTWYYSSISRIVAIWF
jgi:hypothetical protein